MEYLHVRMQLGSLDLAACLLQYSMHVLYKAMGTDMLPSQFY